MADGKIETGTFKTKEEFPKLTRESGTLLARRPDDDSEQPGYCSKLRSPKARLFPVKGGSGIDEIRRQLR